MHMGTARISPCQWQPWTVVMPSLGLTSIWQNGQTLFSFVIDLFTDQAGVTIYFRKN